MDFHIFITDSKHEIQAIRYYHYPLSVCVIAKHINMRQIVFYVRGKEAIPFFVNTKISSM